MTNPLRGEVTCRLNGKDHTLQFTVSTIMALEQELKRPAAEIGDVFSVLANEPKKIDFGLLVTLTAAAFQRHHPEVTAETIRELTPGALFRILSNVTEAFTAAFDTRAEGEDRRPPKAGSGTGKTSSSPISNAASDPETSGT